MQVIGCLAPNRGEIGDKPCLRARFAALLTQLRFGSDLGVVMRLILSGAAILAAGFVFSMQPMSAQSLRAIGGPAEMPPASFQGQQYVDSRGCVFMRAGLGGKITWVARIDRDRRPICNQVSMAEAQARLEAPQGDQAVPQMVSTPQSQRAGKPMATVASKLVAQRQIGIQAPVVVPGLIPAPVLRAPAPDYRAKTVAQTDMQTGARSAACPTLAPVLERMALQSGGTVLVCTRGDGTATGWLSPGYPAGVGGTLQNVQDQQVAFSGNVHPKSSLADVTSTDTVQTVIAGAPIAYRVAPATQYVAAWKDGRLNPLRGIGTPQGWAMQAQIWTQKAPARLVADRPAQKSDAKLRVTQSTMSAGQPRQQTIGQGAHYVQVGTFGNSNNVSRVAGALAAMGLPVSKSRMNKAGRDLVIVFAGPFDSAQAAQSAMAMTHQAGFGDAFLR